MCATFALINASIAEAPFPFVTHVAFPKAFCGIDQAVVAERTRLQPLYRIRRGFYVRIRTIWLNAF